MVFRRILNGLLTIDGQRGFVFKGALAEKEEGKAQVPGAPMDISAQIVTATKVYVNLSIPGCRRFMMRGILGF